jgi:hypothetical protein
MKSKHDVDVEDKNNLINTLKDESNELQKQNTVSTKK